MGFLKNLVPKSLTELAANPIANMGMDMIGEVLTTLYQDLINQAMDKLGSELSNITKVVDSFFMLFALATTAQVEVLMEMARGNAKLILKKLDEKDKLIKEIQDEIVALNNALAVLTNSAPFFKDYLVKLIQAQQLIDSSNRQLKSVSATLKFAQFYNQRQYDKAVASIQTARDLILPDRSVKAEEIRQGDLMNGSISFANYKKALAVALTIPGISAKIAEKFASYAEKTLEIDGLIVLFTNALNEYIAAYKRNDTIDQITIKHIKTATDQLDTLLNDMGVMLTPTDGRDASPTYPYQVSASATVWGLKVVALLEWLKNQPGKGSAQLDLTGTSVELYQYAISKLNSTDDISYGSATLKVSESIEDVINTGKVVTYALFTANTVISKGYANKDIYRQMKQLRDLFSASKILDSRIREALLPFTTTKNNLTEGAGKILGNLSNLANSLGLDRVAGLISSCDVAGLLAVNAEIATSVGAAVFATNKIIEWAKEQPTTTDQDLEKITAVRDDLKRSETTKRIESSRSASNSIESYKQARRERLATLKKQVREANLTAAKMNMQGVQEATKLDSIKDDLATATRNAFNYL